MNNEEYWLITELERKGEAKKAFQLLVRLADEEHPMVLLDLSSRYYSIEGYVNPVYPLDSDREKSKSLAKLGKKSLERMVLLNDGEAMRMLAYCYFGHWGPYLEKNIEQAEKWLLKSYKAECYAAANDLATFYQGSDIEKAKFYYQEAEKHDCRVIYNPNLETEEKNSS